MEQKLEFATLASVPGANISMLCRRFSISRDTGHTLINRYTAGGADGLAPRSRKPHGSPGKAGPAVEDAVVRLRGENPAWGARKLRKVIERDRLLPAGSVPSATTINAILKRKGCLGQKESEDAKHWQRFERAAPNELWQMDFKGPVSLLDGAVCHPLTITDDHSRYNISLTACGNQRHGTVKDALAAVFTKYGLPLCILADNGTPWGLSGQDTANGVRLFTALERWLILLGVGMSHGRPYHPQTQGKEERFHRTLKTELLRYKPMSDMAHCQREFDAWREKYNCYRPHEAIGMEVPAQRYRPSGREFNASPPPPEYDPCDTVRKVAHGGLVSFGGREFRVGKAFTGDRVALRQSGDSVYEVYFCNQQIRTLDLNG